MKSNTYGDWRDGGAPPVGTVFGWDGLQAVHIDGRSAHEMPRHFSRPTGSPGPAQRCHADR